MEKTILIGTKEVKMRATAATPLHYRNTFKGYDLFKDLQKNEGKDIADMDLSVFERLAFIMSGEFRNMTLEEWLEQFDGLTDVVEACAEILTAWNDGAEPQSIARKNEETAESSTQD